MGYMKKAHGNDDRVNRKLDILYKKSGIETRYSCLPDFTGNSHYHFYNGSQTSVEKRLDKYAENALNLSLESIEKCINGINKKDITHLITVSCTGMSAPGLDIELVNALGLSSSVSRTSVNFMGCYAAIHAIKLAYAFCKAEKDANVLIVCTELCTLHFQKEPTDDNLLANCLFSDGSAALLISNTKKGFEIKEFYSEIHSRGANEMTWKIGSSGFLMGLSGIVPRVIKDVIKDFKTKSLTKMGWPQHSEISYAIHPGGKKIVETIAEALELKCTEAAVNILKKYGNMSSATILFVLQAIQNTLSVNDSKVWGIAFGPGLVIESFGLEYVG